MTVVNAFPVPEHLLADAIQEGTFGLVKAIEGFEVERFNSFSTYAFPCIYQSIQQFLFDNSLPLRVPSNLFPEYLRFRRERRECVQEGGEAALRRLWESRDEGLYLRIMRILAIEQPVAVHRLDHRRHPCASDDPVEVDGQPIALCREALKKLRTRDLAVLQLRYGLTGKPAMSLRAIGERMRISKERVRQIQVRAEWCLRCALEPVRHLVAPQAE